MIRGGTRSRRIALVSVCVLGALAVAAPTAVVAQPAVDEYSLDIPSGGSGSPGSSDGPGAPSPGATASGSSSGEGGAGSPRGDGGRSDTAGQGGKGGKGGKETGASGGENLQLDEVHDGGGSRALDTNSRSAPEVVADSLLDGAMWPLLAALLVITGFGAWRILRGRGILSRHAG